MFTQQERPLPTRESTGTTILVVEDDSSIGAFLHLAILQETSYRACVVRTAQHALEAVHQVKPSLFILDASLHSTNGIALYDHLHAIAGLENVPAIITTTNVEQYQPDIEKRQLRCLSKPFEVDALLETIERLLA